MTESTEVGRVIPSLYCCGFRTDREGFGYTMVVSDDGDVYSCGSHHLAVHGHKSQSLVFPLKKVPTLKNIKSINTGGLHSIFLDFDGYVYTMGSNRLPLLGINKSPYQLEWTPNPQRLNLPPIKQIACGSNFSCCVSTTGDIYTFGRSDWGQLGHGDFESYNYPKKVSSLNNADYIEIGGSHVICKTFGGDFYCWGNNQYGQLGIGMDISPMQKFCFPYKCGKWPKNIVEVKSGDFHILVLTSNREVYSCGDNSYGQLGRNIPGTFSPYLGKVDDLSDIVRMECGVLHSACIDGDKRLYLFGSNVFGQLGYGDTVDRDKALPHPKLNNIVDISSQGNHTIVKTASNELYGFGFNEYSQIGAKCKKKYQTTPVRVFQGQETLWGSYANRDREIPERPEPSLDDLLCSNCSEKMKQRKKCSRCKSVYYCSKECQVNHWKTHRKECIPQ